MTRFTEVPTLDVLGSETSARLSVEMEFFNRASIQFQQIILVISRTFKNMENVCTKEILTLMSSL